MRILTVLKILVLIPLVFLSLVLLYVYLTYPAVYINRLLRWGEADVYDYQKFPARELTPSKEPFHFETNPDEERVRTQFEASSGMEDFESFLEANNTQAFLVIQDDTILYERYFNRASRDSIVTSFSTAKSFVSALIGIAISEGHIHSVEDPITDYIPELKERDPAFANITIRNLLMMSSGIKYEEFPFANGDDAKTYYYPDLRKLALEHTFMVSQPGKQFLYNNYHPLLLGLILERATGTSVTNYLQEKIWTPIGMEYSGSWSLDETGFEKMESGINARAIDFAKFGRLFLQNGDWNGVQVVPAEWVIESTQADRSVDYETYYPKGFIFKDGQGYYKYMWWGIQHSETDHTFIAMGNHGQFVYIYPEKKLLILRFGESYGEFGDAQGWLDLFTAFARNLE